MLLSSLGFGQDFNVTAPYTSPTRTTCGAVSNCAIRASEDHQYQVTIPSDGTWIFSLCNSSYDTYIGVGTSLCGTEIGVNDDDCGLQSSVTANITAGVYHVTVEAFSSTGCGDYILEISGGISAGPEDDCTGAIPLQCGDIVTGNTSSYNPDVTPFCGTGDGTGGGVWYELTGTGNPITASLCNSSYDTKIRVYEGSCASLSCVVGNDDDCGAQSEVQWTSTLGTSYYILVHGWGSSEGAYELEITCGPPPSPLCFDVNTTPYLPYPFAGTSVTLPDDRHSFAVNIGFNFCYMGTSYNQCLISSNNYITFNLEHADTFSPFSTAAAPVNNPDEVQNAILGPWQDIDPGVGGNIYYQTLGAAPDRVFVVSYDAIPMFSCNDQIYSSQIVLMEGSNCIQTMITEKPICATWNGGKAVYAINGQLGTSAAIFAGRNDTQWTALDEGTVWTPTCGTCLTANSDLCLSTVLPIELIDFSGRSDKVNVQLDWQTASEVNNAYFTIERSTDGEHFESIGTVSGMGNSHSTQTYVFTDTGAELGINYYRLSQTDHDGEMEQFPVISVRHGRDAAESYFYPNPVKDLLHIPSDAFQNGDSELRILDLQGQVQFRASLSPEQLAVNIGHLDKGIYIAELHGAQRSRSEVIIKR